MMYGDHMGAGGWVFSIFVTLIVLGLIVAGFVWLASSWPGRDSGAEPGASAREVLERRLATGEITVDHYDEVRAKLAGASESSPTGPIGPVGSA